MQGDTLYGADVYVHPDARGADVGHHLQFARDGLQARANGNVEMVATWRFRRRIVEEIRPGLRALRLRSLFALVIIDVNEKQVVHVAVTRGPSERSTAQQLRNAMPFDEGPQFLIRDRDNKFGGAFDRVTKGAGVRVLKTAVQAPLMNSVVVDCAIRTRR